MNTMKDTTVDVNTVWIGPKNVIVNQIAYKVVNFIKIVIGRYGRMTHDE